MDARHRYVATLRDGVRREANEYRNGNARPLGGYVVQLAVATHKLSRLLAKDPVTSPLRVPFTTFAGTVAPGELHEEVRGDGLRHAVGELVTCPMCLGRWVALALWLGLTLVPTPTRLTTAGLTAITGADFLEHAYAALEQAAEG